MNKPYSDSHQDNKSRKISEVINLIIEDNFDLNFEKYVKCENEQK